MDFKKAALRSAVIITIIVLSVLFGVIFQTASDKAERSKYPLKFEEFVKKYSYEYGVPQNVIYAVIKCESDFDSSLLSDDERIGLMQLSPAILDEYKTELHDAYDTGMLYDPETNIKYGTYRLSKIYLRVGTWRSVFASLTAGVDTVEGWLADKQYSEISEKAKPKLVTIPDAKASEYAVRLEKVAEKYNNLYFDN